MKQLVKLVVFGTMLAAGSVGAEMMDSVKPYLGLDYYHAWMKGAKGTLSNGIAFDFTKDLPKSYPSATAYVGAKFTDYVGIELGTDWSVYKKKTVVDSNGNLFKDKTKRQGLHVDIVGSLPLNDCFELLGFVGAGLVATKSTETVTNAQTGAITIVKFESKANIIPRLGMGASYMVTDMIGLRAKAGWENTHRLKMTVNTISFKPFKDTISLSLGVFIRW